MSTQFINIATSWIAKNKLLNAISLLIIVQKQSAPFWIRNRKDFKTQISPNGPNGPNGPKWSQMSQNGPKLLKIELNGPKWTQVGLNRPQWTQMNSNGSNWTKIDLNGPKCP